ncbi:hypothetical protein ACFX16_029847 [Malus domestica]
MSFQAQRELNTLLSRAQASHPCASHFKQPTFVAQLAPTEQPTLMAQPAPVAQPDPAEQPAFVAQPASADQSTLVTQPAPAEQPTPVAQPASVAFQTTQIDSRLVQPSRFQIFRPTIEPGAFSPHFSLDLTFPNSNLTPGVYHTSTAQEDVFIPSYSSPNGEQHLSRQVIELTRALV